MQWFYSKDGSQQGPVTEEELRDKLVRGEVALTELAWRDGMGQWMPISRIQEFQAIGISSAGGFPPGTSVPGSVAPVDVMIPPGEPIPNYLWQAIAVTVLCCPPFGVPAIVYAAKVDALVARGDIPGAMAASASAKMWCIIAVGSIVALVVVRALFSLAGY